MTDSHNNGQAISLRQVSKFWDGEPAVDRVELEVEPGSFTVLLGPSGCGKSTSLRIIAGLEAADQGEVLIGDRIVNQLPPAKRDIAMVFQSYALFPHITVADNILFGLRVRRTPKAEQKKRLLRTAELLGLTDYLDRRPSQLSGGQQQRVALGRAIIAEKPVCLMDEPLSNLDAKLRNTMRTEIRDLQQAIGFSMVYVTHDQAEAITMADQVVLMKKGRIEQCGSPREIYEKPATAFVAGFIGTPPMNLVAAEDLGVVAPDITVGVRPEHVRLSEAMGIKAKVEHVEYLGADVLLDCRIGQSKLLARIEGHANVQPHSDVRLIWNTDQMHFFDNERGARLAGLPEGFGPVTTQL
ncbi:MAG: ABC transporter ATP-binding protein [Granulosicoccus sp.]